MSESSLEHKKEAPTHLGFAVIIISTSRFEALKLMKHVEDPSGDLILRLLEKTGHKIVYKALVPDDRGLIGQKMSEALDFVSVDVIITCGGTGITPSDVTIETVRPMLKKNSARFRRIVPQVKF